MTFGGDGLVILGKLLKGPLLTFYVKANWSCDSAARVILRKASAESTTAWSTPKALARYLRQCSVGHSHMDDMFNSWGNCSILGSPWSSSRSHLAFFFFFYWAVESTMGRMYNTHSVQFSDSFSYDAPSSAIYIVWQLPFFDAFELCCWRRL